jgi:hypothetical protein
MAFLPGSRPAQRLPVDRHHLPRRQLGDRTHPGHEALFQLFWIQSREYPVEGVVRRDARGQTQERPQPFLLGLAIVGDVVPALRAAQYRRNRDQKNLFQQMLPVPLHTWITQLSEILQGIFHIPFSPKYTRTAYSNLYASALPATYSNKTNPQNEESRENDSSPPGTTLTS